jgi:ParB-like chromosome segregation protein Spo0J
MQDLKIEYVPFSELVPAPHNSNTHSDEQVLEIANSIRKFGFTNPILIDANKQIIAGEGRYLAAKLIKRRMVPTITLGHLTDTQRRAYLIADNKISRNSEFDFKKLTSEVKYLIDMDFDIGTLGFNNDELLEILKDSKALTGTIDNVVAVGGHTRTIHTEPREQATGKGKTRQLAVLVLCDDADHQLEVYNQLTTAGLKCQHTVI